MCEQNWSLGCEIGYNYRWSLFSSFSCYLKVNGIMLRLSKTARDRENMQTDKHPWDPAEDELLSKLVKIHGIKSWTLVSQSFVNRTGKHCRERWFNHLNPDIKKGDWTPDDDFIIIAMQKELGNQWAKMTKCLPGRTDNAVKNRFYAVQRANKKLAEAKLQASQLEASKEAGQDSDGMNKSASGLSLLCEVVFAQAGEYILYNSIRFFLSVFE